MPDLLFFTVFWAFIIGITFGSFANVVIYRWPQGLSLLGRSRCQYCQGLIEWYKNVPLFSYFYLGGYCHKCGSPFSIRYPFVEFLMGLAFALVVYHYGLSWTSLEYLIMSFGLIVGSFIDIDHFLLPDEITLGGLVLALIGGYLNPERNFLDAFLGFLFGGGILWAVAYIYYVFTGREGLGGGDIKLLAWMGALLGWKAVPFIILSSSITGSLVGISLALKSQQRLKVMIPFGPFIAFGAFLYIFGLKTWGLWYVDLFFPEIK